MEEGLNDHSDRIEAIQTTCTALVAENERLKNKVEDLENHRVLHDGQTLFFETPEKAREF